MKKPFIKRPGGIPKPEQEKIRHEINTYFKKYNGLKIIAHRSVGIDDCYYVYYVENHGFDDYVFLWKLPNSD